MPPRESLSCRGKVSREDAGGAKEGGQTEAAVKRGETLEQARKSVSLEEFRKALAGDSQLRAFVFHNYVTLPAIAAAYKQPTEKR